MQADPVDRVWLLGHALSVPTGQWPAGQSPRAVLRLAGPVQPTWRAALAEAGLTVRIWCPPQGVCVDLPARWRRHPARLAQLDFLVGGIDLDEAHCQRFEGDAQLAASPLPPGLLDVVCFSTEDTPRVAARLAALGIPVLDVARSKLRVGWAGDPAVIRALPGVKVVDQTRLPTTLGLPLLDAIGLTADGVAGLDGSGETLAVADTGLDSGDAAQGMHPDFSGRIAAIESLPLNPSWLPFAQDMSAADDAADRGPKGHGTHVAGLAMGDGAASNGLRRGVAQGARLVFLALEREVRTRPEVATRLPSGFYLAGRPIDLRELLARAAALGATIHNYSWGDAAGGAYTDDCHEADLYLRSHPEALLVCAAGNDGADRDGNRVQDGGSLYAPASAKNTLAVAATEGPLVGQGARITWGVFDPGSRRFAASADRTDAVSGEPDRLAPISSAGPTRDGRCGIDLCAPGTNLAAPRSRAGSAQGWGLAEPLPLYMYNGGTSMAAPVVAGAAALVRQGWRRHARRIPSGMGLKALLLLGALPVRGRGGNPAQPHEAGFGRLDVAGSLPPAAPGVRPGWRVALRDSPRLQLDTGQQRDVVLALAAPTRLCAVLCWYDAPGERLVNDLDLCLLDAGGQVLAWGGVAAAAATTPDRTHPAERLDLALPAGRYRLRVQGHNVMDGPQRYALVWVLAQPP